MVNPLALLLSLVAKLRLFWNTSIRHQLVLSFSVASLVVMVSFSYLMFSHQHGFLYEEATNRATGLARVLASSSASWVLANDLAGLQEVVAGFSDTPDLKLALVLSLHGEVLGASDPRLVGQFVSDKVSLALLQSPAEAKLLVNQSALVDAAFPIMAGVRHIGWARVEMTRASSNANLRLLGFSGLGFSIIAVAASLLVATWLARQLTRSMYHLMGVARTIEQGQRDVRSTITQSDEVGKLAQSFNHMLDTLNDSEEKLGRLNRLYAAWTKSTEIIVREGDEQTLLNNICKILAERVPFELVWIGVPDQDNWVLPVASSGVGTAYLEGIKVSSDAEKIEGQGPFGKAIREGVPNISNDFLSDPKSTSWIHQAIQHNYRSAAVFPIFRGGQCYGGIAVYSAEIDFFTSELIVLIGGLADDISFALNNLDREKHRRADVVYLERAAKVFEYSKEGILVTDSFNNRGGPVWLDRMFHVLSESPCDSV
jgi:HAMP domain-containing protein